MSLDLRNKKICVFGLGKTGVSVARYFERINQAFFVVDTRVNPPGVEQVKSLSQCDAVHEGGIENVDLKDCDYIVLSPGIDPRIESIQAARQAGVNIIGDIELFVNATSKKIVAITGSNGKSTVTDLTYQLLCAAKLRAKIGGNFGVPALDYLPEDDAEIYVLELSSFQLDTTTSLQADVATVLNVTEDHMDRYDSFEDYRQSKLSIYINAEKKLFNADDLLTKPSVLGSASASSLEAFSLEDANVKYHLEDSSDETTLVVEGKEIVAAKKLKLVGRHNWSNALASLGIVNELDIKLDEKVIAKLCEYSGLAHRFQLAHRTESVDWVNDSKATNVGATIAAINGVNKADYEKLILIAGGLAKGADLSPLKQGLADKVDFLIVLGEDADLVSEQMLGERKAHVSGLKQAVEKAIEVIKGFQGVEKTMVLMSPACASLDMFSNFEERGNQFVKYVRELAQ